MSSSTTPRWLRDRSVDEDLIEEAPELRFFAQKGVADVEEVADMMVRGGLRILAGPRPRADTRPPRSYWQKVRCEFHLLLCTNHPKYRRLRRNLASAAGKSNAVLIGIIAAALADRLGLTAGAITGFVAVCLAGAIELGTKAFCAD